QVRAARRDAEHDQHVRPHALEQQRQLAIDLGVAGREDVGDAPRARWLALRQADRERAGGIDRNAGKRSEAGEQNRGGHAVPHSPNAAASSSTATAGEILPSATAASSRGSFAFSAASDRSRDISRSSSSVHIHLTCCARRRAANAPLPIIFSRCSSTLPHTSATPSPVNAE